MAAHNGPPKNESETLFEAYLKAHGLNRWEYEPVIAGKYRRPDYRVWGHEAQLFFEVKEFRQDPRALLPRGGAFDPYAPIREKINAAREKFGEYKEFPCSLVLYNVDTFLVDLDDWTIVMGSMLGDAGFRFAVDRELGRAVGGFTPAFLKRGKMIDYKRMQAQNTTISALVVVEKFPLGQRRLASRWVRKETELGRKQSWEEFIAFAASLKPEGIDAAETVLRVIVYENPYARIPLPRNIFVGPLDERFGPDGDNIKRVFAGVRLQELEAEEAANRGGE
jgi:hypothetical protein